MILGTSLSLIEDEDELREDLHTICKWETESNMNFNAGKFEIIRYSPSGGPRPRSYSVEGIEIKEKVAVKNLGLFIINDRSFSHHIEKAASKGKSMCGWIARAFQPRVPEHLQSLWKTVVVPRLE